jgi:hypothetical protein
MKRTIVLLVGLWVFAQLTSCRKDFIEKDLTGKIMTILAPADGDTVAITSPLFWWNEIEGARVYHLQLVYPDFNSPQQLLYDTLVEGDRFIPVLNAGNTYYWRVRAENGSSQGDWVVRRVTVDSSTSLANQTVQITSPASNGYVTALNSIGFAWTSLPGATLYRIEIENTSSGSIVLSTTSTVNSLTQTFGQGSYQIKVRAENASSITAWSLRNFSIDQTAPVAPVLVSPANTSFYATAPSSLTFDWTSAADALTDSLYIGTDSTFATGLQAALLLNSSQGNYTWTNVQSNTNYFWRVRSVDAAGNSSNYSSTFKFVVN